MEYRIERKTSATFFTAVPCWYSRTLSNRSMDFFGAKMWKKSIGFWAKYGEFCHESKILRVWFSSNCPPEARKVSLVDNWSMNGTFFHLFCAITKCKNSQNKFIRICFIHCIHNFGRCTFVTLHLLFEAECRTQFHWIRCFNLSYFVENISKAETKQKNIFLVAQNVLNLIAYPIHRWIYLRVRIFWLIIQYWNFPPELDWKPIFWP